MKPIRTDILEILQTNGFRLTRTRRALAHIFSVQHVPLSATALIRLLAEAGVRVNKTTVYRELDRLLALSIIESVRLGDRTEYYELRSRSHHHHLVCVGCENVEDVDIDEQGLIRQERNIARARRFTILKHSLEFFGLCRKCQSAQCS